MKILYDHQIFTIQKYGGISRYFIQIISNLPPNVKAEIAIKYSNNEYLKNAELANNTNSLFQPIDKFLHGIKFPGKKRLFEYIRRNNPANYPDAYALNKDLTIELLKKQDFDIFHPTYYDDYFLDYIGEKPFVLTIHDMIHEIYPEMLNDPETVKRKSILAQRAAHIIAVSENTKKDIIEILKVPESKISVIYHANSLNEETLTKLDLPEKYLLFVGERWSYKNFVFFINSIAQLLKENRDIYVICTGRNFDSNEKKHFLFLDIEGQIKSMSVSDEGLIYLYQNAIAFIFPSYYEGFGIPILEAFTMSCPVILSQNSCFPEIARDAALYFNPKIGSSINDAINEIISNSQLRNLLIQKGKEHGKTFSWKSSASKTVFVYEKILE